MIPDVELLSLLCTILTRLEVGEFTIKVRLSEALIVCESFVTLYRLTIEEFLTGSLRSVAYQQRRSARSTLLRGQAGGRLISGSCRLGCLFALAFAVEGFALAKEIIPLMHANLIIIDRNASDKAFF